jgi:rhodanese-related sulfurtransferase
VLIDLRPGKEARKGHIKGAVGMPPGRLTGARSEFPEDRSAPIILYTGGPADREAFDTVRGWGYKNVSFMKGGLEGWKASGGKLARGEMPSTINYVKKLPRGEIGIEEFTGIIKGKPSDKLVLDVRDAGTVSRGILPGAVNIPLQALDKRLRELPKDREIIIHCNTGIMAGMAFDTLQKSGYRARFLNAVVQVGQDGSFEVNEK